jgi:hypothetical protein
VFLLCIDAFCPVLISEIDYLSSYFIFCPSRHRNLFMIWSEPALWYGNGSFYICTMDKSLGTGIRLPPSFANQQCISSFNTLISSSIKLNNLTYSYYLIGYCEDKKVNICIRLLEQSGNISY